MAQQNVEIVPLMWAGLNEEGTSWLELLESAMRSGIRRGFPSQAVSGARRSAPNGLGLATLLTDDLAPFTREGLLPDERAE